MTKKPRPEVPITLIAAALVVLALAPAHSVDAGACAQFGTLALSLVDPGGAIPLDPSAAPLLVNVIGSRRVSSSQRRRFGDPFTRLRVRGPRGAVAVTHRGLAPGLHRVEGRFRAGRHRFVGVEPAASVRFARGTAAPLPAPVLTSAVRHTQTSGTPPGPRIGGGRGGPRTTHSLEVGLNAAAPAGAWALLMYEGPADGRPRAAFHSVQGVGQSTSVHFHEGGGSSRCGPSLPRGYVPVAGAQVGAAWLSADGRLSPQSSRVPVTE